MNIHAFAFIIMAHLQWQMERQYNLCTNNFYFFYIALYENTML